MEEEEENRLKIQRRKRRRKANLNPKFAGILAGGACVARDPAPVAAEDCGCW